MVEEGQMEMGRLSQAEQEVKGLTEELVFLMDLITPVEVAGVLAVQEATGQRPSQEMEERDSPIPMALLSNGVVVVVVVGLF